MDNFWTSPEVLSAFCKSDYFNNATAPPAVNLMERAQQTFTPQTQLQEQNLKTRE